MAGRRARRHITQPQDHRAESEGEEQNERRLDEGEGVVGHHHAGCISADGGQDRPTASQPVGDWSRLALAREPACCADPSSQNHATAPTIPVSEQGAEPLVVQDVGVRVGVRSRRGVPEAPAEAEIGWPDHSRRPGPRSGQPAAAGGTGSACCCATSPPAGKNEFFERPDRPRNHITWSTRERWDERRPEPPHLDGPEPDVDADEIATSIRIARPRVRRERADEISEHDRDPPPLLSRELGKVR